MQKKVVRIIAIVLAVIMVCSVFIGALATVARAASMDELKERSKELKQEIQEWESKIHSAENEQAAEIDKKEKLDQQIIVTQQLIENIAEQIAVYDGLIADKELEVIAAQAKEDEQYELYKNRIRAMEENGTISYFEIIFSAKSFTDLLSRIELISEIMTYDESVYDDYVEAKQETIAAKEALEEANDLQKEAMAEQEAREEELLEQVEVANKLITDLENNIEKYKATYDKLQADEDSIQNEINAIIAQQQQQQQNNSGSSGDSGVQGDGIARDTLVWPSKASRIVTSPFGTRFHPVYKEYRMHTGIDIGASYGTDVVAANGGKVITAKFSKSYGYYIVVDHGKGMTTLYAHLSKMLVSVGDSVSQGQTIGRIGSTGVSTGPHLHFEVSVNGSRVNPLNYYSNYTLR